VKGCSGAISLGWRPLTERRGRQICEQHWLRHKDEQDSFDLFDEFGFRRPAGLLKLATKKDTSHCSCGRELLPGRRFCTVCAAERERQRKKRAYHKRKDQQQQAVQEENTLNCKQCGGQREAGHTYCPKCSERRSKTSHRQRQQRYWKKLHVLCGSN